MTTFKKSVLIAASALTIFGLANGERTSANETGWTARTLEQVTADLTKDKDGNQEYTIQWGDTLSVIAQATDTSLESLVSINEIQDADLIYPGTKLVFDKDQEEVSVTNGNQEKTFDVSTPQAKEVESKTVETTTTKASEETTQATTTSQAETSVTEAATTQAPETTQVETTQAPVQEVVTAPASQGGYALTVEATAYSYQEAGLSTFTADGTNLLNEPNVIAVDPSVIPLGSLVEIPGYGVYRAADTGGAIVGNRIDIHFTTVQAAINFGRQTITIRVLN